MDNILCDIYVSYHMYIKVYAMLYVQMKHFIYFILCFFYTRRIFCFIHNSKPNGIDWYLFFIFLFTHQTCVALSETAYLAVDRFFPFFPNKDHILCRLNTHIFVGHASSATSVTIQFASLTWLDFYFNE